jgi:hypothetical protein
VGTAVVAVGHPVAVAVPACVAVAMTIVGTAVIAVIAVVVAIPHDVARWWRRNNDHVRTVAAVSVVRLRLSRRAQSSQ